MTEAHPIIKWPGGKRQLLPQLLPMIPTTYNKYIEPFFGGGALFFAHKPERAVIADKNAELINLYTQIQKNVDAVIGLLKTDRFINTRDNYMYVRGWDNIADPTLAAARTIYLSKTCFNGAYRVNKAGKYNQSYGNYKKPLICDEDGLRSVSEILQGVKICCGDFYEVLRMNAETGDFIYLDPPYAPIENNHNFTGYTADKFSVEDQYRLSRVVDRLVAMGCTILLTNSDCDLVDELYGRYKMTKIECRRSINEDGSKRRGTDSIVYASLGLLG